MTRAAKTDDETSSRLVKVVSDQPNRLYEHRPERPDERRARFVKMANEMLGPRADVQAVIDAAARLEDYVERGVTQAPCST